MNTKNRNRLGTAAAVLALALAGGCGGGGSAGQTLQFDAQVAEDFIETYADIMHANYCDIANLAANLKAAIDAFVANPNQSTLDAARAVWVEARIFYQQSEIGRFYDGPIDRVPDGPEGEINAWPLDESHIDYVEGAPNAGIINDPVGFPVIDEATLRSANEAGGEENVSIGWHAIEFLLWGQDTDPSGPGSRPFTDYVTDGTGTAQNQDRRAQYLVLCAQLLIDDITRVKDEWAPNDPTNFRASLLALPIEDILSDVLTGLGSLAFGELRGERLVVAFQTKLQEDEHSCFSDTTHNDHFYDMKGIENVWKGVYESSDGTLDVSGTGLRDLAATVSGTIDADVADDIEAALLALGDPDLDPFDQAILGLDSDPGRLAIQAALDALAAFNQSLSALANDMDVVIVTTLQD